MKTSKLREDFKRNKHLIRKVEQCINAFNIQDLAKKEQHLRILKELSVC